ncbi:RsmF rRNA methyltransferase first C-terminal domain-containing protein [Lactovum miscens]|uniref:16S rRNA C967 or C1407 C5-methylase (RsmB/RsmF family)/NOL1/NOP2/fmu family ribosome biogenesis protein n=1 Tax=Lactovum miscens TaxID=190387 RepID=A0A841C4B5_9LACT|nr:RsmB/NOP family class I SAM-dependent RNA methyltransferase [Lactovum miscens]MBB5888766.1 16S rRNA C967 or C1407 C5-methylase (RsmB/RsmF family)/NOL1/NOP2/fmu family ribosome biogenesis protein [Lactovum miscens]
MKLPIEFSKKYEKILKSDFQRFVETFDEIPISAFRVNPLKKIEVEAEKIEDSDFGYYGKISGKSKEFLVGEIYSQEPAAQMVGQIARPEQDMRVLDLCAAPGGKSSHLLSYLGNTGLLVSNDISTKRSKILVENLERWGNRNNIILNESPDKLADVFSAFFDMIVIDAPCSGEGMFRKDPDAMSYWSPKYVEECVSRQKKILSEAMKMLAPTGVIVYSTCTWSPEEDEEMVAWLLNEYPNLALEFEKKYWPFEFKGEGQFLARFRNNDDSLVKKSKFRMVKSNLNSEQLKLWKVFRTRSLNFEPKGILQAFGDNLFLLPESLPDLSKLRIARNGLHIGVFKKNRFEPSYALGIALNKNDSKQEIELTDEEVIGYAKGNPIIKDKNLPNGWTHLLSDGHGFGFSKYVDGMLKNNYPKGLRIHG